MKAKKFKDQERIQEKQNKTKQNKNKNKQMNTLWQIKLNQK